MTESPDREGAAVSAVPTAKVTGGKRRPLLLLVATVGLVGAGVRLIGFLPVVQERRLSQMSLPELARERSANPEDPRVLYYIGRSLNRAGRFAEAEGNLRHGVGLDLESERLRDEWARALLGVGNTSEAFSQLRQFVGTHPSSGPAHLSLGKFYFAQKSMPPAYDALQKAVALSPQSAEAWAYLSQTAGMLSKSEESVQAIRKALALEPRNAGYHLLLASYLTAASQRDEAGREHALAAELDPQNAAIRGRYALWLAENARDEAGRRKAEDEARQAAQLDPNDGAAQLLIGRLQKDAGRVAEAIPALTKAAELSPEEPAAAQLLTEIYTTQKDATSAARWRKIWQERQSYRTERHALYQQLRVSPNSRELHRKMARLLGVHGDIEGSLRNYATVLRRPPDSVPTMLAVVRDLLEGGHVALALPLAQKAVDLGPHSPDAREALGDALLQSNRVDEAIASYNYATNYIPTRAPAIQARVNRYVAAHPQPVTPAEKAYREASAIANANVGLSRSSPQALELAKQADKLDPGNVIYLRLLMRLQFGARKMDDAIATARQIVTYTPYDAPTQALLAVMLVEKAKTPQELAEVETHLDAAKRSPEADAQRRYGAGLLALARKNGPLAVTELSEARKLDPNADITFFKLSQAYQLSGNAAAAAKALAEYQRRQESKRVEFGLQSDISAHPADPARYEKLIRFYEGQGRKSEAEVMREIARRRFPSTKHP